MTHLGLPQGNHVVEKAAKDLKKKGVRHPLLLFAISMNNLTQNWTYNYSLWSWLRYFVMLHLGGLQNLQCFILNFAGNESLMAEMSERALSAARPDAASDIAQCILSLVNPSSSKWIWMSKKAFLLWTSVLFRARLIGVWLVLILYSLHGMKLLSGKCFHVYVDG